MKTPKIRFFLFACHLSIVHGIFNVLISRVSCTLRFALLRFDIGNYNNFHRFFHNDSEMILAETGAYKGADSIEEYT